MEPFEIPDIVRDRVSLLGPEYAGWLDGVSTVVAECAAQWGVELGYPVDSASTAVVVRCRRAGSPILIKVWPERERFVEEERVLRAAQGRGYGHIYASDAGRQALLLEALGPVLDTAQLEARRAGAVLKVVTTTLAEAWQVPLQTVPESETDGHPAAVLRRQIEENPPPIDVPDCRPAIERALLYAQHRLDDTQPERHVVLHGNAAPGHFRQLLAPRAGAESGYVLISPHGIRGDREFDLGTLIRESTRPLLHADDAVVLVRGWCAHLAEVADADAEAIWQWAFLQRVARGLALVNSPSPLAGRLYLQTAMALIARSRR